MGANTELVTEVALCSMAGLVTGYTLKKLGQMVSFGLLAGYSGLQLAKIRGWVAETQIETISETVKSIGQYGRNYVAEMHGSSDEIGVNGLNKFGVPSIVSFGSGFYVGFFHG